MIFCSRPLVAAGADRLRLSKSMFSKGVLIRNRKLAAPGHSWPLAPTGWRLGDVVVALPSLKRLVLTDNRRAPQPNCSPPRALSRCSSPIRPLRHGRQSATVVAQPALRIRAPIGLGHRALSPLTAPRSDGHEHSMGSHHCRARRTTNARSRSSVRRDFRSCAFHTIPFQYYTIPVPTCRFNTTRLQRWSHTPRKTSAPRVLFTRDTVSDTIFALHAIWTRFPVPTPG